MKARIPTKFIPRYVDTGYWLWKNYSDRYWYDRFDYLAFVFDTFCDLIGVNRLLHGIYMWLCEPRIKLTKWDRKHIPYIHAVMTKELVTAWWDGANKDDLPAPINPHSMFGSTTDDFNDEEEYLRAYWEWAVERVQFACNQMIALGKWDDTSYDNSVDDDMIDLGFEIFGRHASQFWL